MNQTVKIAIAGMGIIWGDCENLEAFEQTIYQGQQRFTSVPRRLNQEGELSDGQEECYLLQQVAAQAIEDAKIKPGSDVTVLIIIASEQPRLESIAREITEKWRFSGKSITVSAKSQGITQSLRLAQTLLLAQETDAVLIATVELLEQPLGQTQLNLTQTLSYDEKMQAVIAGEGAAAIVLTRSHTNQHKTCCETGLESPRSGGSNLKKQQLYTNQFYAAIDAIGIALLDSESPDSELTLQSAIDQACEQAFHQSQYLPSEIGYLEVWGSGLPWEDEAEIAGLLQGYQLQGCQLQGYQVKDFDGTTPDRNQLDLTCAIGSVKANIGQAPTISAITSLIKAAVCLTYRYLPGTPHWSSPKQPEKWQDSPFYVPQTSRPWFQSPLGHKKGKRITAVNLIESDRTCSHLLLSERLELSPKQNSCHSLRDDRLLRHYHNHFNHRSLYWLPIAAVGESDLLQQLIELEQAIIHADALTAIAQQTLTTFQQQNPRLPYVVVILGHDSTELTAEIQRAKKGIHKAFATGKVWRTPIGSYFTAHPLGQQGNVAFVYPGAFNSYLGLGQDLFCLFPEQHDQGAAIVSNLSHVSQERRLYPRSLSALSKDQLMQQDEQLLHQPIAMLESGITFATVLASILQQTFEIRPQVVFGYSLGEISMMCAHAIWGNYDEGIARLNQSPLFKSRLFGEMTTVQQYWGLSSTPASDARAIDWSNHVLMTRLPGALEYLKTAERVYLTHVNSAKEIAIAGETQACLQMIQTLKCDAIRLPAAGVLHCEVMRSEFAELVQLNLLPIYNTPDLKFYAAATSQPLALEQPSMSQVIAQGLCQPLDFPKLVNQVYQDGAKIFIEVGAGSTCSRWINEILKHQDHVTISCNKRGTDDHTALLQALAKLVSHGVSANLSVLSSAILSGNRLPIVLDTEDRSVDVKNPLEYRETVIEITHGNHMIEPKPTDQPIYPDQYSEVPYVAEHQVGNHPTTNSPPTAHLEDVRQLFLNQFGETLSQTHQSHSLLLRSRQQTLEQMSHLIESQIDSFTLAER